VELPDPPVILVEVRVQDRLVELVVTARVTVPVKPLRGAIVIVEMAATLAFTVTLIGLTANPKSCKW
jgi:hypothetical protein